MSLGLSKLYNRLSLCFFGHHLEQELVALVEDPLNAGVVDLPEHFHLFAAGLIVTPPGKLPARSKSTLVTARLRVHVLRGLDTRSVRIYAQTFVGTLTLAWKTSKCFTSRSGQSV